MGRLCFAESLPPGGGKTGSPGETCRNGNFRDGQIGLAQQLAGSFQAQVTTERPGAAVQPETGLPVRQARARAGNLAMMATWFPTAFVAPGTACGLAPQHPARQAPPRRAGGTHFGVHEPVADFPRQVRAVTHGDQGVHQVRWRRPAGAGDAVPVRPMQRAFQEEAGVALHQGDSVFPVGRRPPVFHDAGSGTDCRPTRDAARNSAVPGLAPERTAIVTQRTRLQNRTVELPEVTPDRADPVNMTG